MNILTKYQIDMTIYLKSQTVICLYALQLLRQSWAIYVTASPLLSYFWSKILETGTWISDFSHLTPAKFGNNVEQIS